MKCTLCEDRKARRFCPGVRQDICAPCCGQEREQTILCPFDCEFLHEARRHERLPANDPKTAPSPDVRVTEAFLDEHEALIFSLGAAILESFYQVNGAVDSDVAEALDALVRTHRTLDTGLYYETRPDNPIARALQGRIEERLKAHEQARREQQATSYREAELVGALVFFQRTLWHAANGRRKGRAFLDYLRQNFEALRPAEQNPIIVAP